MTYSSINFSKVMQCIYDTMKHLESNQSQEQETALIEIIKTGKKGRPKYFLTEEHLLFYIEHYFTIPQISQMLHISESTIKRRMREFNFSKHYCFR